MIISQSHNFSVLSDDRKEYFKSVRLVQHEGVESHILLPDFAGGDAIRLLDIRVHDTFDTNADHRISELNEECKYCTCFHNCYGNTGCCLQVGFMRLKLQKILHSWVFHSLISILVIIDVLTVLLELTIETRQLAHCRNEQDCNYSCNDTRMHLNESYLICGFVGLMHQCISEDEATIDVSQILSIISIFILSVFLVEIIVKIFAFGFKILKQYFEIFDIFVIILSFLIDVLHFSFEDSEYLILFELIIVLRLWRFVRIFSASIVVYNSLNIGRKRKQTNIFEDPKVHQILIDEFQFSKCEVLRLRKLLVCMKINPFPLEYGITPNEELYFGLQ